MKSATRGFSLVELLITIAILGVLAAVVLTAIDPASQLEKARDSKRKQDINQIATALIAYQHQFGQFPAENVCDSSIGTGDACPINPPAAEWSQTSQIYTALVGQQFLKLIPADPVNNTTYHYRYEPVNDGEVGELCFGTGIVCRYWIGGRLEKPADATKPVFRCSDRENLADGTGCKEVAGFYQ